MFGIGEVITVAIIFTGILLFGGYSKLPKAAESIGKSLNIFRKTVNENKKKEICESDDSGGASEGTKE